MDDAIETIEQATIIAWPARERASLFGWTLQATLGHSRRVNSVWPIRWTGERRLSVAVDVVEAWYAERGLVPCFKVVAGRVEPPELLEHLAARGYRSDMPTSVMTRPLAGAAPEAEVLVAADPDETWFGPLLADGHTGDAEERRDVLLRMPAPRAFASLRADGRIAATGASVATGDLASIFVMRTATWARREGRARRILHALMGWARGQGASTAYLQVDDANLGAVALYETEGFARVYGYDHWRRSG